MFVRWSIAGTRCASAFGLRRPCARGWVRALSMSGDSGDPHAWLEEVEGEKQLAWVKDQSTECVKSVGEPKETETYTRIKSILDSKEKIPHSYRIGDDDASPYYNFWQDATHVQGIWRRTTLESFKSADTEWHTVLDLDKLPPPTTGTAKTWVWHGSTLLDEGPSRAQWDRALIKLSPGGSDADICREFCLKTEEFVAPDAAEQGFALTDPAKTRISYRSRNETLVGTDFGGDKSTLTDSGYPRVVKSWKRGTPITDAVTVFECQQADISASMYCYHDRGFVHEFQLRSITFYTSEYFHRSLTADGVAGTTADAETTPFRKVPIPEDAELGTFADLALVTLRTDLKDPKGKDGTTFLAGAMISLPMDELMEGNWSNAFALFSPTPARSLSSTSETRDYVILKVLEDVKTVLEFYKYDPATRSWMKQDGAGESVAVGDDIDVSSHCRNSECDNTLWLTRDGYLTPTTLEMGTAEDCCGATTRVKSKPAMFNADGLCVEQQFATSADGTRIPYFIIRRKDIAYDGTNAVLLDAYGGFEIAMLPGYSAGVGAGWLEKGGVKVIANIRGGGEYGPKWHQAALKEHRYKCYEDVEAIAQALIDSKLTCKEKLACIGGSNGGLLVGNLITRPISSTLFGAAVCQVPLLDMKRYSQLLAGASWMGEYGDPSKPEEWAYLRRHSPYHILRHDILGKDEEGAPEPVTAPRKDWKCPKSLFVTSTRDDRVHPAHARKMVACLQQEAGDHVDVVQYWENTEGGHGGAADNSQRAYMWALTYNFLAQVLAVGK
eukprot:TRINITY_DN1978_c0_g1_i1.p1 TRINITY_DN1978_c0_g1~~TRINITY_DN1978_c0_g1_i1.p1  ORF type:complete len:781 (+),score=296.68 TRINITY_DN1978_c0_g1_i1:66-2408(+)